MLQLILDCHDELPGIDSLDWRILSDEERARANRFVFDRDRQQSIRARALLRRQLGQACERAPEELVFRLNPYGKPLLDMGCTLRSKPPLAPVADLSAMPVEFNLSHTSGAILIGLSDVPIGVDVEHLGRDFPESIMSTVFTEAECDQLRADPLGIQIAGFSHWSRKEALIKADGRGLSLNPASFELSVENVGPRDNEFARARWFGQVDGQRYFGVSVALRSGYVCAVATTRTEDPDLLLRIADHW